MVGPRAGGSLRRVRRPDRSPAAASPRRRIPASSIRPTVRARTPAVPNVHGCRSRSRRPDLAPMHLAATYADTWVTTGDAGPETVLAAKEGAAASACRWTGSTKRANASAAIRARSPDWCCRGSASTPGCGRPPSSTRPLGATNDAGVTDFVVHWPRDHEPFSGVGGDVRARSSLGGPDRKLSGVPDLDTLERHPWNVDFQWRPLRGPFRRLYASGSRAIRRARFRRHRRCGGPDHARRESPPRSMRSRRSSKRCCARPGRRALVHRRGRRDHVHDAPRRPFTGDSRARDERRVRRPRAPI